MAAQQKLLTDHFEGLGATVEFQRFTAPYPADGLDPKMIGHDVPMANIIVRFNPAAQANQEEERAANKERIMLCGHYDTLPFPLQDKVGSPRPLRGGQRQRQRHRHSHGTGQRVGQHLPKVGVDFVLFDGEEFLFNSRGKYFFGSEHFADEYAKHPPAFRYRYAVLMDMVGSTDLRLPREHNSATWEDSQPLVKGIWDTACAAGR